MLSKKTQDIRHIVRIHRYMRANEVADKIGCTADYVRKVITSYPIFNRYDIIVAYYLFGRDWHSGQWSEEYKYICRAQKISNPTWYHMVSGITKKELGLNARAIYNKLVKCQKERTKRYEQ